MKSNQRELVAYVDGSSTGGVGCGGWAVVWRDHLGWGAERSGGARNTTNQRQELIAAIAAIKYAHEGYDDLIVYSDSAYVVNCIRQRWYEKWRRSGWRNSKKDPVANRDLWELLLEAIEEYDGEVEFRKVRGHQVGEGPHKEGNDRADMLAVAAKRAVIELSRGETDERTDER